jgi:lipid-A-disaccharide synthase
MPSDLTLAIVAGEHSGDAHGGNLVKAFDKLQPAARWFGAGGATLASAGVELLVPMNKLAVVGIGEVISHLPDLWREMAKLKRALADRRPDAIVLVDFPDFNFRLARTAHGMGIPVVYYITPQVWAWRQKRTEFLKRYVDRALVIFPFEKTFLEERGVEARFVGHPLVDTARIDSALAAFLERNGLSSRNRRLALLPGSRTSEVKRNLPPLMDAAGRLTAAHDDIDVLIPWADGLPEDMRRAFDAPRIHWIKGEYLDVLGHAHAAATASGTATLEAAIMGIPQIIVYRVKAVTYAIGRRLVKLPWVGLPNVVLGRMAIQEFIQGDFTGARVAAALDAMLTDSDGSRRRAQAIAGEIRNKLGEGNASARAAQELLIFLKERQTAF